MVLSTLNVDILGIAIKGFTAAAFMMMMWRDSRDRRYVFLVVYCVQVVVTISIEIWVMATIINDSALSKEICGDFIKDPGYPNEKY